MADASLPIKTGARSAVFTITSPSDKFSRHTKSTSDMSSAIPETSTLRPTLYSAPQSYEYLPSQGYYTFHEAPRLVVEFSPSHHESFPFHQESSPFHQGFSPFYQGSSPFYQDFFPSISAEELEEREYQRALEVVANYRRRQAEKEAAAARRQELAEAARQRHTAALATGHEQRRQAGLDAARRAELTRSQQARARLVAAERQRHLATFATEREQRRQAESLAARRAEITRSQQARARMVAAEREQALSAIVQQLKGPQPVCDVRACVMYLTLINSPLRQPISHTLWSANLSLTR